MKLVILSSSPRINGNSDRLCQELARGAEENGNEVVTLHISQMQIGTCKGCEYCHSHENQCIQKDDMQKVLAILSDADVVAVATPVYYYNVCAQLKLFFDRTYCMYKEFNFKKTIFLATSQAKAQSAMDVPIAGYMGWVRCLPDTTSIGEVTATGVYEMGEIEGHPALKQAYELGKSL